MGFLQKLMGMPSKRSQAAAAEEQKKLIEAQTAAIAAATQAQKDALAAAVPAADSEPARQEAEKRLKKMSGRGLTATTAGAARALDAPAVATRALMGE